MNPKQQLQRISIEDSDSIQRTPQHSFVEVEEHLDNRSFDFFNFDVVNYIISGVEQNTRELRGLQLRVYGLQRETEKHEVNLSKIVRFSRKQQHMHI